MRNVTVAAIREHVRIRLSAIIRPLHPSSRPFLSGDMFRSLCDVKIDDGVKPARFVILIDRLAQMAEHDTKLQYSLFVDLNVVQKHEDCELLTDALSRVSARARRKIQVLFHNSDKTLSRSQFVYLSELGYRLWSVNVVDTDFKTGALPIGLENRWRMNNGRLRPFKVLYRRSMNNPLRGSRRSQVVFAAFNVATNTVDRSVAREACLRAGVSVYENRISPRDHRKLLRTTMFVISPPGNGLDCHRTWEAIYLGCIPVVLKRSLAKEFWENLPIFAVDDWSDFFSLSADKQVDLYQKLIERPTEMAMSAYWERRLAAVVR